jgi:UDP-N-acetylglucosamine--N-acetylmuramyl-(pentapeptide) pyrophosphoryl-undecaprenol N-acetylglucosamine transferase
VHNARALVEAGAAILMPQGELEADSLRDLFQEILFSPERLRRMQSAALTLARPDAADAVLNLILGLRERCPRDFVYSS